MKQTQRSDASSTCCCCCWQPVGRTSAGGADYSLCHQGFVHVLQSQEVHVEKHNNLLVSNWVSSLFSWTQHWRSSRNWKKTNVRRSWLRKWEQSWNSWNYSQWLNNGFQKTQIKLANFSWYNWWSVVAQTQWLQNHWSSCSGTGLEMGRLLVQSMVLSFGAKQTSLQEDNTDETW